MLPRGVRIATLWMTMFLAGPGCGGDDSDSETDAASVGGDASTDASVFDASPYDAPPCACNFLDDICEALEDESDEECACDPDCDADGNQACMADDLCDTWCDPEGACVDPDCNALPACSS